MLHLLAPLVVCISPAVAGDWKDQEVEPKLLTDVTAYTVGKRRWHLGLYEQSYGLFDNVQVGTSAALWPFGLPNLQAKITAIQTPKFDAAFDVTVIGYNLEALGVPGGSARLTPLSWTASWMLDPQLSLHFGQGWWLARLDGAVGTDTIAEAMSNMIGVDLADDLEAVLSSEGGLYAGANLTLTEGHISADLRINRRDSLVWTSSWFVALSGLVAAGVESVGEDATSVEPGASVRFSVPLKERLQAMTTLSYQLSYERFHLRLGIPYGSSNLKWFALPRALQVYWVLGPNPD